jgi:hypothetical protein
MMVDVMHCTQEEIQRLCLSSIPVDLETLHRTPSRAPARFATHTAEHRVQHCETQDLALILT